MSLAAARGAFPILGRRADESPMRLLVSQTPMGDWRASTVFSSPVLLGVGGGGVGSEAGLVGETAAGFFAGVAGDVAPAFVGERGTNQEKD
jgi:hypothetical protein